MNKINRLMSLVAVALCCTYGCDSSENSICIGDGCENDGSHAGLTSTGCETSDDCKKGEKCLDNVCTSKDNTCESDSDCKKGYVCKSNVCTKKSGSTTGDKPAPASCADDKKNNDETDVDCGGSCALCADGKQCSANADCMSNHCEGGVCKAGINLCADGIRSGDESDVDCGGSCSKCADGQTCNSESDCASNMCDGVCVSCSDGILNGNESDVDCGGSCGKCSDGTKCNTGDDCANGFCDGNVCTSCSDGVQNGDEADVDCGGRCGATCAADKPCNTDNDCESYNCVEHICKSVECPDMAEAGEIIINEVFANPDTEAKMAHSNNQQMKYIELYNKSDKTLQLHNLSLTFAGNEVHAKGCIPPKSYLIIHPSGQTLTALDLDAKVLASDNIETAICTTSGDVRLVKRADSAVIHSATVPEAEKGTAAGRDQAEDSSTNDEALVPHSSVPTIESGVKNLYSPGLPNNVGFPMG